MAYIEEHRPEIGITVNMLKNIGWKGGNVTIHDAAEFNSALWYYGIQSKDSIQMFLATVMVESGYGNSVVEGKLNMTDDEWIRYKNNLEKNLSYPITYTKDERGAGYIQITGEENQNNYLQYILGSSGADSISASDRVDFISTNYPILCEWISLRSKCRKRFKCVSSRRLIPI